MAHTLRAAWRSEICGRAENQDRVVCDPIGGIFAVIDGMGGQAGGGVAAELAAARIVAGGPLVEAFGQIRDALDRRVREEPGLWGMGAVATAARVTPSGWEIAHVGDTRAWLWRPGVGLSQLTRDHTIAQEARDLLNLPPGASPPGAHQVTRDLGSSRGPPEHWVATFIPELQEGDRLLLTSDGVHGVLPDATLEVLLAGEDEGAVVAAILDLVVPNGGDNASVVVVGVHS